MKISTSVIIILIALFGNSIALDEETRETIDDAFKKSKGIVDLQSLKIVADEAQYIAEKIKNNRNITSLSLRVNEIRYQGALAIANVLNSTFITSLNLGSNKIGADGIAVILEASKHSMIDDLNLDDNAEDKPGVWKGIPLAASLENTKMSTLSLEANELNATEVKVIAGVLNKTRITSLYLGENPLGTEGVSDILTACKNYPMKHLDLSMTVNEQWGGIPIASLLVDTKITSLALPSNEIEEDTGAKIVEATKHTRITSLDLSYNNINGMNISGALNYSNITNLDLQGCGIDKVGVSELAEVLPNTCIVDLNLERNNFGDDGVRALAKALPNTLITNLLLFMWDPPMNKSLGHTVEKLLEENKVRIDGLYNEFKKLVVKRNGSLEFGTEIDHQRRANFAGIISGKGQGYIEHFSENEDKSFTREQIEEFILNIEKKLNAAVGVSSTPVVEVETTTIQENPPVVGVSPTPVNSMLQHNEWSLLFLRVQEFLKSLLRRKLS